MRMREHAPIADPRLPILDCRSYLSNRLPCKELMLGHFGIDGSRQRQQLSGRRAAWPCPRSLLGSGCTCYLRPTSDATTIRVREGKTATVDGPFAETKEQLEGGESSTAPAASTSLFRGDEDVTDQFYINDGMVINVYN